MQSRTIKGFFGRLSGKVFAAEGIAQPRAAIASASTPAEYVEAALVHHSAGRLAEAEALYGKALAVDAEYFDALHLLGVVHQQSGNSTEAVKLIERAISAAPGNCSAHSNLGLAYRALDRLDEADACFARAVELNPSSTEALNNLGNLRKEREQFADAEAFYRRALAIDSAVPAIWKNLGQVLQQTRRLDDALDCYKRALDLKPSDATILVDIGTLHSARAEFLQAEHHFRLALQSDGDLVEAMCNLGDVLGRLDRLVEAEQFCRKALTIRPNDPDSLNTLAAVLLRKSALDEAETCCRRALSIRPDHAPTQTTMGSILNARDRPVEAEECFRLAMRLSPKSAAAQYNLSILKLMQGNFREGLALYEGRFDAVQGGNGNARANQALLADERRWRGEELSGQRLLVWAEQGYGDTLMMLRYLPMLARRGAGPVIVLCERELKRIVQSVAGCEPSVACTQSIVADEFDLHCPIMSLPFNFESTRDSIPDRVPYIAIPEEIGDAWKTRLSSTTTAKVGLAWAGSKSLRDDERRSIPLSAFEPLMRCKGVQLISLQKGDGAEQVGAWQGHIEDWMDDCDDFMDTAALVNSLDLVISVDTAIVHLSGALGKPVWLLNRYGSEWRWGHESEGSPWYPSMRIFRQRERSSWNRVIAEVTNGLAEFQRK